MIKKMLVGVLALSMVLGAGCASAEPVKGVYHALRLSPGDDLKQSLSEYAQTHNIGALAVVTCVGSLSKAGVRYANVPSGTSLEGPFEIVSLVGCGGIAGWHLHIGLSDSDGKMIGGHLMEGSLVFTTAEIVLVELKKTDFQRSHDPQTGYKELDIRRRWIPVSDD